MLGPLRGDLLDLEPHCAGFRWEDFRPVDHEVSDH